jgi:hypothetical protein
MLTGMSPELSLYPTNIAIGVLVLDASHIISDSDIIWEMKFFLIACFDLFLLHRNSKSLTQFNIIGISISS